MTYPPADDRLRHLLAQEINTRVATWELAFLIADDLVKSPEIRTELNRIAAAHTAGQPCGDRNCHGCFTAATNAAPLAHDEGDELVCVDECGSCDACGMEPFGTPAEGWREAARFLRRTARDSGYRISAVRGAQLIEAELRRRAEEAAVHAAETRAPEDPWSIEYHQPSPARLNPAVCICGLGPDAVVHNEPPHECNTQLKAWFHAAVDGICTDCHHHKTASCHTQAQPESETPEKRPRCPHCQLPHDLTPGSLPVIACEATRQRITQAEQSHSEGDHSLCCRADCPVLRQS
ncbi:hypothetical protein [Streptomyces sp. DSM 40484]|uniref:hypothetical protein n=1 Tax=Streptomyces kroppenstedtii TaxID=3051181 RepID=UPI0028D5FF77|nr:hypothetical protein [Streptomyces sp. DSM 40484]